MRIDMKPQVSVVVTCYNYGKFVAECLDSLQKQTFSDFEVIIVDDGSTDNSAEQIHPYLQDCRFCYIEQSNGGQANAKNRGIKESTAEFIAFLDADDLWKKDKLEKQIQLFNNPDVGVVYSRAQLIDAHGKPLEYNFNGKYLTPRSGKVSQWLFLDNFIWFSSSIVRRECFKKFGKFDESLKMGIDWDLWLRISTGYDFDFVNEPLLAYRVGHSGQMSKNIETRQQCSDWIMDCFLKSYPGVIDKKTVREAYFSTYCSRGNFFRKNSRLTSYRFFIKAIAMKPVNKEAYKGLIKNIINHTR